MLHLAAATTLLLLGTLFTAVAAAPGSRAILTHVSAPWSVGSDYLLQEAAEAVGEALGSESYHDFLWHAAHAPPDANATEKLAHAWPDMAVLSNQLGRAALALRAYAPAVAASAKLTAVRLAELTDACGARGHGAAWALIGHVNQRGYIVCHVAGLTDAVAAAAGEADQDGPGVIDVDAAAVAAGWSGDTSIVHPANTTVQVYPHEHIWHGPAAAEAGSHVQVILHGVVGSAASLAWLTAARALPGTAMVWRHVVADDGGARDLGGWGAGLLVKSTEYRVLDDREAADGGDLEELPDSSAVQPEWTSRSFYVLKLLKQRAGLGGSANATEPDSDDEKAERWKGISEATASYIAAIAKHVGQDTASGLPSREDDAAFYDPLAMLARVTGNFPLLSSTLRRARVPMAAQVEQARNSRWLGGPGSNIVLINGVRTDVTAASFNMFALLPRLQQEAACLAQLGQLAVPDATKAALRAVAGAPIQEQSSDAEAAGGAVPAAAAAAAATPQDNVVRVDIRPGAKGVVRFLNSVETDERFSQWPRTVQALLRPAWGMPAVRRNLLTAVLVLDASSAAGLAALATTQHYVHSGYSIRFGYVLGVPAREEAALQPDAEGEWSSLAIPDQGKPASALTIALLESDLSREFGMRGRATFLQYLATHWQREMNAAAVEAGIDPEKEEAVASLPPVSMATVTAAYVDCRTALTGSWTKSAAQAALDEALEDDEGVGRTAVARAMAWVHARGVPLQSSILNGRLVPSIALQTAVMPLISQEIATLSALVRSGKLTDASLKKQSVLSVLYDNSVTLPGWHPVIAGESKPAYVPLGSGELSTWHASLPWLSTTCSPGSPCVSVALVADLNTAKGEASATAMVAALSQPNAAVPTRFALVHAGEQPAAKASLGGLWHACHATAQTPLDIVAEREVSTTSEAAAVLLQACPERAEPEAELSVPGSVLRQLHWDGHAVLLVGGRAMSAAGASDQIWDAGDIAGAIAFEQAMRGKPVADALGEEQAGQPDLLAAATAVVGAYATMADRQSLPTSHLTCDASCFVSEPAEYTGVQVDAALDPVSLTAQRAAPLLLFLRNVLGARVRVWLNPGQQHTKPPLQSFYRLVAPGVAWQPSDEHSLMPVESMLAWRPTAQFTQLPHPSTLLTAAVYEPEPWNVQAYAAHADLDNILVGHGDIISAEYRLKSMVVAGQCDDLTAGKPPAGLQLLLQQQRGSTEARADTLVMSNYGYFQLQASPGVWQLSLAPGPGAQLYSLVQTQHSQDAGDSTSLQNIGTGWMRELDDDGAASRQVVSSVPVVVRDFVGTVHQLRVQKQPGKERMKLLATLEEELQQQGAAESGGESGSMWARMGNALMGKPAAASTRNDTIHVFSVASGHLYERFLRIMMLSVVKHTQHRVKFWLVENFLSPSVKESLPYLAARYGFEVGYVSYKWPNWLLAQTEKQRIIWSYKVLFLDELFPLNVPKIIFIDADQVVRADIAELWYMDLHGKPYAYTPFCDSRKETLGFQFWRSGYWANHLQGKPYHISALYVVDLAAFRRRGVGDTLRSVYSSLARDENSLANLDQDLPNFAQHMVPIHSLPQEWLWCESWCSDDSKADSKTIDLCNNPLHKEPKLDMAKRVIAGPLFDQSWVQLDTEVATVEAQRVAGQGHTGAARAAVEEAVAQAAS